MVAGLHSDERSEFARLVAEGDVGPIFQPISEPRVFEINGRSYIAVGGDLGTRLSVGAKDRTIVSVDPETGAERFVSRNLAQFAAMLGAVRQFWTQHANDADPDYERAAHRLRDELGQLDAAAFDSDETWWSMVVEQIEDGLL